MRLDHALMLAGVVCILAAVFACGWYLSARYHEPVPVVERFAPPIDHDDGSTTLVKSPGARIVTPAPKTPAGGKPAGTIELTIKPAPPVASECAPVTVRLDLTDHGADGMRVSERVDGGELLDGVHVPASVVYVREDSRNVVTLARVGDATIAAYGRQFGPVTVGPAVSVAGGVATVGGWVSARF